MPTVPHPAPGLVVVTTAPALRQLVEQSVEIAVRSALAEVLDQSDDGADWVPLTVAVRLYGRSRSTLYRWRRDGTIPSRVVGASVYVPKPGA